MAGWIKISREIEDHWLWQDANRLRWWIDMFFLASWEDKKVIEDTKKIINRLKSIEYEQSSNN